MSAFKKYSKSLVHADHYIYALCEISGEQRIPLYIGKGKGDRCLAHLNPQEGSEKSARIQRLSEEGRLGIDILRHGIQSERVAKLVESTCIDLFGVGKLLNKVRGSGTEMGRISLEEFHNLVSGESVTVSSEHSGLAFLLNQTYKSGMSDLALYEATRGVWFNVPRDPNIRFAFATYGGLVKEVYEIHTWLPAGTQDYFVRILEDVDLSKRWEFVGSRANDSIRKVYVGKVIEKPISYGNPFVKVGC